MTYHLSETTLHRLVSQFNPIFFFGEGGGGGGGGMAPPPYVGLSLLTPNKNTVGCLSLQLNITFSYFATKKLYDFER